MSDTALKYNSRNVDRSKQEFTQPKIGSVQNCTVVQCKYVSEKNRLENIYQIDDGEAKGFRFWDYISLEEASAWRLDQFLIACGIDTLNKPEGTFNPKKLEKKKIKVRVKGEKYEGEDRAKAGTLLPPGAPADEALLPSDGGEATDETWTDVGARIDTGEFSEEDEASITAAAEEAGLDPADYPTWVELGVALDNGAEESDEDGTEPDEDEGAGDDEATEEGDDLPALGAAADEGEADAIARLTELAGENSLDPDDYATWADLAEALAEDPFAS